VTDVLRPYKNKVISINVKPSWAIDVETYGRWLTKMEKENELKTGKKSEIRGFGWALTRRICLMAFADYYGHSIPKFRDDFILYHAKYGRFPQPIDFRLDTGSIKIASCQVNEKWNIGPELTSRITEKAFSKGNKFYIMMAYNVDRVYIIGWLNHDELRQHRNKSHYELKESRVKPIESLTEISSEDTLRWYI